MVYLEISARWTYEASEVYIVFNRIRWGEKCLPVDKTLLSNKALGIFSRHFAVKPWLTHVEAWRTKKTGLYQRHVSLVYREMKVTDVLPTYAWH